MKVNVVRATSLLLMASWLQNEIDEIILAWKKTPEATDISELVLTSKLLEDLDCIKENAATVQKEMLLHTQGGNLWTVIDDILRVCEWYLKKLVPLKYPNNRGSQGFRRHKPGGAKILGPSAQPTPFPYRSEKN